MEQLRILKQEDQQTFSTQYQQQPVNKETQEFHEGFFRYHSHDGQTGVETPMNGRIFTTCDPAFKQGMENDNSCVMTGKFVADKLYILEYTVGKFDPMALQEKLIYHIKKYKPEKVGIEAFQAQMMI